MMVLTATALTMAIPVSREQLPVQVDPELPLASVRPSEWVCLGIQNPIIETNQIWGREYQVEVFQRFGQPEALSFWVSLSATIWREKDSTGTYFHVVLLS